MDPRNLKEQPKSDGTDNPLSQDETVSPEEHRVFTIETNYLLIFEFLESMESILQ